MIKFSLRCANGHNYESWFQSNEAFDSLNAATMLSCPICGSTEVDKSMMTPQVHASGSSTAPAEHEPQKPDLSKPATREEAALLAMRRFIEKNSENVGRKFPEKARAMHEGDIPKRSIFGEANLIETMELLEDGIPVSPLPWSDNRKTN